MINYIATIMLACTVLGGCQSFTETAFTGQSDRQDTEDLIDTSNVVVLVKSQRAAEALIVNAARVDYQLIEKSSLDNLGLVMLNFRRPPGVSGAVAISDMQRMEKSATAGLDHLYTIQSEEHSSISPRKGRSNPRLYAHNLVEWPDTGCRALSAIGMIDGRVDLSALPSTDNIIVRDFSRGDARDVNHGTAIASLLVGQGRLDHARLYSASVISDVSERKTGAGVFEIIQALDWMLKSGVSVVNISLAGPYNDLLDQAVRRAASKGMIIIAAVGNDGPDANPRYPAAYKDVIAVTAIDSTKEIYRNAVRGDHVDFAAPGVDVFVELNRDGKYLSGTSVAAPFVTALIAGNASLIKARNADEVRLQIESETVDLGLTGRDPVYGSGLIQAHRGCDI